MGNFLGLNLGVLSNDIFECPKIVEESFIEFHRETYLCKRSGVIEQVQTIFYYKSISQ